MQKLELLPLIFSHQTFFQNSPDLIPRDISPSCSFEGSAIKLISGPPHAGKTSFLGQVASSLNGIKLYIDFKDSRMQKLGPGGLQAIEEIAAENLKKETEDEAGRIFYFLDEIHNLPGWENWVDRLYTQGAEVYLTSSKSKLINEFSSRFAGRGKVIRLFPFSFKEYLRIKGFRIPETGFLSPSRSDELLCMFLQYFESGGFPDVIKHGDIRFSRNYFEEGLQQGAVAGYDIENLRKLATYLISNMASEYSLDNLKKVSGIEKEDVINSYLAFLEDIFLLYRVPKLNCLQEYDLAEDAPCKIYAGDTGFFKAIYPGYPDSLGLRFENLVFLELLRREKQVFCFRGKRECDFVIKDKNSQKVSAAIQVSICFGSPAVREREILGLTEALDEYGLEEGFILTMDDEETLRVESKTGKKLILVKSVWKWMLE
ncbi:ATP-binding protein [Methanosarcina sp. MSH10X1]|uniref:ATP-binding protein n=1 Tax=Methanosarcina sp. MSH10X1 TaxID=2507075 RepID=UPI000FFB378B|nr:ATP-binding protein [Methanosarcina sp. MSH10X1]RXA16573.1 ATP-binding protein [Methanosarcina sp. MSH10X1]